MRWHRVHFENCLCFDIVEFYSSIIQRLLTALDLSLQNTLITPSVGPKNLQTEQTLLFNQNEQWIKKDKLFDVTMGSCNRAEHCELVVTYLLSQLKPLYENSIGPYQDDGLAVFNETQNN